MDLCPAERIDEEYVASDLRLEAAVFLELQRERIVGVNSMNEEAQVFSCDQKEIEEKNDQNKTLSDLIEFENYPFCLVEMDKTYFNDPQIVKADLLSFARACMLSNPSELTCGYSLVKRAICQNGKYVLFETYLSRAGIALRIVKNRKEARANFALILEMLKKNCFINERNNCIPMDECYFNESKNIKDDLESYAEAAGFGHPSQILCNDDTLALRVICQNGEEVRFETYLSRAGLALGIVSKNPRSILDELLIKFFDKPVIQRMDKAYLENISNLQYDFKSYALLFGVSSPWVITCGRRNLIRSTVCKNGESKSFEKYLLNAEKELDISSQTQRKYSRILKYLLDKAFPREIGRDEIKQTIKDSCIEKEICLPEDFDKDAEDHLPEYVDSFSSLKINLCAPINESLKRNRDFLEKYYLMHKAIAEQVRLKLLIRLNIEGYASKKLKDTKFSPRKILHLFLRSLPEGEIWNTGSLSKWTYNRQNFGEILVNNLVDNFSTIPEGLVDIIIGNDAENLLTRNPFVMRNKPKVRSDKDAVHYLTEFLNALPEGESWFYHDLLQWQSNDETNGHSIVQWMLRNKGAWSERTVKALLGSQADELLRLHPFKIDLQYRP